jgi:esterase/lipase superfamily enzyme
MDTTSVIEPFALEHEGTTYKITLTKRIEGKSYAIAENVLTGDCQQFQVVNMDEESGNAHLKDTLHGIVVHHAVVAHVNEKFKSMGISPLEA